MRVRTLLISTALVTAFGCTRQRESSGSPPANQAGQPAARPIEPMPPVRPPDAGSPRDASVGGGGAAAPPMLPPNFTLQCSDEPESEVPDDPLSAWEAERAAHGALGRPATFALRGASYRVHGVGVASVQAPFTLHGGNIRLVGFANAEVEGIAELGRVELYAGGAADGAMPASAGAIDELA